MNIVAGNTEYPYNNHNSAARIRDLAQELVKMHGQQPEQ